MDTPSVNRFGSVLSITSPSKEAIHRVPSECFVSSFDVKPLNQPVPQFPSIRSIHPNELANNWVNDQLNIQNISATDLLFKIAKRETPVPTNLSLQLVFKSLIKNEADMNDTDYDGKTPLHWALQKGYP